MAIERERWANFFVKNDEPQIYHVTTQKKHGRAIDGEKKKLFIISISKGDSLIFFIQGAIRR
jgi:hypothetical protein